MHDSQKSYHAFLGQRCFQVHAIPIWISTASYDQNKFDIVNAYME